MEERDFDLAVLRILVRLEVVSWRVVMKSLMDWL